MAIRPKHLLFIEPQRPPGVYPVLDGYTVRMVAALRKAKRGTLMGDQFRTGGGWKGVHTCSCGVNSGNCDLLLENGMVTNSLAAHYLAWHRDEVPAAELRKVAALPPGGVVLTPADVPFPPAPEEPVDPGGLVLVYGSPHWPGAERFTRRRRR